ncbi:MAG: ribonuclease HII [Candidatus Pacebacteria bacterium]|nr:ribonuclease HII [Candidatus Paceibacterota bacterium]MDD5012960.1 ribonuclease HII [Candidatus Paceibacterota bacterium]MDD5752687.1 ribonuclease HII [Candidatus Paceibacterota bacterium]
MIQEEKKLWKKGLNLIVGIDEAGRGPLAGPVVAAAILINQKDFNLLKNNKLIKDSKQLSEKQRDRAYNFIINKIKFGTGIVSEKEIDKINIREATKKAMVKAIKSLEKKTKIDFIILDGNMSLDVKYNQKPIIKGDQKVLSCSVASIVAKKTRDKIMIKYDEKYPLYNFKKHKGYGTKEHYSNIKKHGICEIHRKSFRC